MVDSKRVPYFDDVVGHLAAVPVRTKEEIWAWLWASILASPPSYVPLIPLEAPVPVPVPYRVLVIESAVAARRRLALGRTVHQGGEGEQVDKTEPQMRRVTVKYSTELADQKPVDVEIAKHFALRMFGHPQLKPQSTNGILDEVTYKTEDVVRWDRLMDGTKGLVPELQDFTPAGVLRWAREYGAVGPFVLEESPGLIVVAYPDFEEGLVASNPTALGRLIQDNPLRPARLRVEFRLKRPA